MTPYRGIDARRIGRMGSPGRPPARPEPPEAAQCGGQVVDAGAGAALEAARRADAGQAPHQKAQILAADVHQEPLEHVGMPAQMHPAQSPGFVEMRVGAFDETFVAPAQQSPPARRLRYIAAQPEVCQRDRGPPRPAIPRRAVRPR